MRYKSNPDFKLSERHRLASLICISALLVGVVGAPGLGIAAVKHESPRAFCARVRNDDTLRPPPPGLLPAIHRLFHISGGYALHSTYFRCASGNVLLCTVGANLPCGKANTSNDLPAATQWCESHPDSDFIPLAVTGHDTIYTWRCIGGRAQAGAPIAKLDPRGFFDKYWKQPD
jgi:hypothetical protein